jgi:hypothetical protein
VSFEERQEAQEGAFAEDREQEPGQREVRLVEQRLQRRAPAGAGHSECVAAESGPPREHLDVTGLVGHLHREELHDLARVRMHPAEEPRRHDQGRLLVLDQVRHDLHDGRLDVVGKVDGRMPVDRGRGVPLSGDRLRVEAPGGVGPDPGPLVEVEAGLGAAGLDQCASCRQAPCRVGARRGCRRDARRPGPAVVVGVSPHHDRSVAVRLDPVTVAAAPGREMHRERRVRPGDEQSVAG